MTLKELIRVNDLQTIDFLKIDCQGKDIDILLSAGEDLTKVKSLVIEATYTQQTSLYLKEVSLNNAMSILDNLGFQVVSVVPNGGGECNVFFACKSISIDEY